MRFGLVLFADHQIRLADIFVRAAVPRVQLQRTLVAGEGLRHLAGVAVRVAEVVLDVGVARVAQRRR